MVPAISIGVWGQTHPPIYPGVLGEPVNYWCAWPPPTVGCEDPDFPFSPAPFRSYRRELWVPVSQNPPCYFRVKVYGSKRCGDFELLDIAWMNEFMPPGCMTSQQLHQQYQQGDLVDKIQRELYRLFALEGENHPTKPQAIPYCPEKLTYRTAVESPCRKLVVYWINSNNFVDPGSMSGYIRIEYDPTKPWSWYEAQKPNPTAYAQMVMERCNISGCCMRLVNVCRTGSSDDDIIVTAGEQTGDPFSCWRPPYDENCKVIWCNEYQ